jgi:hypothetical protein
MLKYFNSPRREVCGRLFDGKLRFFFDFNSMDEERVICRSLIFQSNSLIIFYMNTQVHGLNIGNGIGDLKLHLTIERMMFLSLGG